MAQKCFISRKTSTLSGSLLTIVPTLTSQPTPFFKLPVELRTLIYLSVIRPDCRLENKGGHVHCGKNHQHIRKGLGTTKLLSVCSQIYYEAIELLHKDGIKLQIDCKRKRFLREPLEFGKPGYLKSSAASSRCFVPRDFDGLQLTRMRKVELSITFPNDPNAPRTGSLSSHVKDIAAALGKSHTMRELKVTVSYSYEDDWQSHKDYTDSDASQLSEAIHALTQACATNGSTLELAGCCDHHTEGECLVNLMNILTKASGASGPKAKTVIKRLYASTPVIGEGWDLSVSAPVIGDGWDSNVSTPVIGDGWDSNVSTPVINTGWDFFGSKEEDLEHSSGESHGNDNTHLVGELDSPWTEPTVTVLESDLAKFHARTADSLYSLVPECRTCYSTFRTFEELQGHLNACPSHKRKFQRKVFNALHGEACYGNDQKRRKCWTCGHATDSEEAWQKHREEKGHARHGLVPKYREDNGEWDCYWEWHEREYDWL